MKRNLLSYDFFEYLVAIFLVLHGNSVLICTGISHANFVICICMGCSILACLILKKRIRFGVLKSGCTVITLLLIYLGLYFIAQNIVVGVETRESLGTKILGLVLVLIFYIICCTDRAIPSVIYKYEKVILFVSGVSLVFWVLGSLMHIIHPTGIAYSTWTGDEVPINSYYGIYYETQIMILPGIGRIQRNTAIFTEAPMSVFHFLLALLIELFLRENISHKRVVLLSVAVISTLTTTGVVVLIGALLCAYLQKKSASRFYKVVKTVILPTMIILGGVLVVRMIGDKLETGSGRSRIDDFTAGFKAWTDRPIFGHGIDNLPAIRNYMSSFRRNNQGFSNSPTKILAEGGIYISALYLYPIIRSCAVFIRNKKWHLLCFECVFLCMFTFTIVPYLFLTMFIFVWFGFGNFKNIQETDNL